MITIIVSVLLDFTIAKQHTQYAMQYMHAGLLYA
jgi:hypothetical protein